MRKKFLVSIEISLFHEKAVLAGEQFSHISSIIMDTLDHLTFHALYFSRIVLESSFRVLYI